MRWLSLAILVLALPSAATAQTITSRSWSDPQPGMRLLTGRTSSPTTRFYALHVDLCTDYVHVGATSAPSSRRTAASWAGSVGAQAAVNGDFYKYEGSTLIVYGQAVGNRMPWPISRTGERASAEGQWFYRNYGWIAFGPNWVDFTHTERVKRAGGVSQGFSPSSVTGEVPEGTIALVSGFPELVTEGRRVTCSSPTASSCFPDRGDMRDRHPRSAMGITEDRQTFILLVVDGRSSSSAGMYGTELASLMHQLGAWQAFNIDGGGSSQMWIQGRGTINSPSDGSPRAVANHWGIFAGSASGKPRTPGSCMPYELDECFRRSRDGGSCGEQEAILGGHDFGRTTDVDGDGRADVCARAAAGWLCRPSTGDGFADPAFRIEGLSNDAGFDEPSRYTTIRTGDIDGDGLADVCGRSAEGVRCWASTGEGFGEVIEGPALDDAGSWGEPMYYSTIRLGDIDGDGKDDLCARGYSAFRCWRSTGDGFEEEMRDGPAWGNAGGFDEPARYGTIRMADVDGDGRADVCARTGDGIECFLSDGTAHTRRVQGPAWSDGSGWTATKYWSTVRLADVDGDGRADICGRSASDLRCHLSVGEGFDEAATIVAALADGSGWADHDNYATLRTGDVNGDGADDLCLRANAGIRCYLREGDAFTRIDGPRLDDAGGWDDPRYYGTIRLGDVTGDGLADVCARGPEDYACWPSTGDGFGEPFAIDYFQDDSGWGVPRYYSTMRLAGPACAVAEEVCNGVDDDCDGIIDEGCADVDASVPGVDGAIVGNDGGAPPTDGGADGIEGGCACRASPGAPSRPLSFLLVALGVGLALRRAR